MNEYTQIIFELIIRSSKIYLGVFLGFLWIKSPLQKYRKEFVNFTISVFTPFLIFISILKIEDSSFWLFPLIAAILVTIIGLIFPTLLAKLFKQPKPDPAEICTASFSNGLNFPFPIIFAFSPDGLGAAGIFLIMAIIMRNTVGLWISGMKLNKQSLKTIILFVPIWGIILGIILRFLIPINTTGFVNLSIIDMVFEIGIFASLMTIGFGLEKPKFEYKLQILRVGVTRFIISGLVAILFVNIFSLPAIIAIPILVQMMAPSAVYNGLYAEKFNLNTEMTSQIILALTLIALILLPIELFMLQYMYF
ncbi:MAG: hypothetical protein OEY49_09345 [Candidatus Heimdallarchaeota archaeon]|nr:hypothetical protein [Candidatus Heimdallarchaeota archaeon]